MNSLPAQVWTATFLRVNLLFFGIACVCFVAGLASLLLARLRRDRLLMWVGIFSALYGIRLALQYDLLPDAIGAGRAQLTPVILCLTYVMPIPYGAFAHELFGGGWRRSISVWLYSAIAFAVITIPIALSIRERWSDTLNGVLVVGGTVLLVLHVLARRKRAGVPFATSLTWPLVVFGIVVLITNSPLRPARFDIEPFGFLILLAGLGLTAARHSIASERKLLAVEQELATARRIQNSIIPASSPSVPGLSIAARYQPMTAVAGDFYDFLQFDTNSVLILVADVSGHGVPAALGASMLKVCFAAQQEQARDPAAVLAGLNTMLRGSLGGQYVTAACAAIDKAAQSISYSGAGHPPALLLRKKTREIVLLSENGLFIGPFPHATYSAVSVPFESGDRLLLYTDGIIEATAPDGTEFGADRLQHFFRNSEALEPADVIAQLFREISSPSQQDDLTVVLAQFG